MARVSVRIERQEYDAFLRAVKGDDSFPASYDDWIKRRLEEDAKHIAQGEIVHEVVINYDEFIRYCRAAAQKPSFIVLMAAIVSKHVGRKL